MRRLVAAAVLVGIVGDAVVLAPLALVPSAPAPSDREVALIYACGYVAAEAAWLQKLPETANFRYPEGSCPGYAATAAREGFVYATPAAGASR